MRRKLLALTMIVGMGAGLLGFNANSAQAAAAKKITLNDAKQIALKHAKLTAKQVKFIKAKSDIENGKKVYDIEQKHKELMQKIGVKPVIINLIYPLCKSWHRFKPPPKTHKI